METKSKILMTLSIATVILMVGAVAVADWDSGDIYKMHYPQLPKQGGLDVEFVASTLADDWKCIETGPVSDIHFWISWMDNAVQQIPFVNVRIFSDVPDPDGTGPGYSMPGQELWNRSFKTDEFVVRDMPDDPQGWFDPSQQWPDNYGEKDHVKWQQINITQIVDPFKQEEGTIYWLAINFGSLPYVGWKESGSDHFNDDAVWMSATGGWVELRHPDPDLNYSLDLAFVITPEPATLLLLGLGGTVLLRRNKK